MANAAPEQKEQRRRRRWPSVLLLALLVLVVAGITLREQIAAWAATEALKIRYGLPAQLKIDQIGRDQARIASISLGSGAQFTASDITLQFHAAEMRIDRIEIGRIEIHARYDGHELTLGELDPMLRELTAPDGGSDPAPLPSIILHKIVTTVDTPLGSLSGDGMATIDQGVIYSQFTLSEPEQRSAIHLDLNAALSNQSPQPQGKVTADLKANSALWEILDLPPPDAGTLQLSAQLKVPTTDAPSGIRLATGSVMFASDWTITGGGLSWAGQPAPIDLQGTGRAVLSERRLEVPKFDLKTTGGWSPDSTIHLQGSALADLAAGQSPTAPSVQATIDLAAQTKQAAFGSIQAKAPTLDLGLQLQYADNTLQIRPSRDGSVKLAQAAIGPALKFNKPVTLTLKKTDDSMLNLPIPPMNGDPIEGTITLGMPGAELTLPSLPAPVQVSVPSGVLAFTYEPDSPFHYSFDAKNAAVTLDQPTAAVKNLAIGLKGDGGKLDVSLNSPTANGPGNLSPGTLDGKATLDGNKLSANAKFTSIVAKTALTAKGGYDLGSGKGRFDIELPPVAFAPGGLQPGTLLPGLKIWTENVTGTVAAKGPILIDKGDVTSQIAINLQGLTGKFGPISLRNLNSVVEVDRIWPLTTAADQIVSIELADVGLPLTNGLIRFKVDDGSSLSLAESRLEMMSGHVTLDPVTLKLGAPAQQIHLNVDKIAVHRLFELFAVAGLDGDGILSGEIPVTLFPAGLAIDHAKLAAEAPGHLRYDPAQAPAALANAGGSVKMALSALSDFHYDRLEIDLDRAATGDTELGLHIAGRNPSFYNGYPVEFNLSVTGRLDEALRKGLAGYQVPDMIRERLKSFNH